MAEHKPKEGARWGADPPPTPIVIPQPEGPPPEYIRLRGIYGQQNVEKALEIYEKLKHQYPHIQVVSWSPLRFATVVLECAQADIKRAADDGRAHSLPEALDIAERILGQFLVVNPTSTSWTIPFGDENTGRKAQAQKAKVIGIVALTLVALTLFILAPKIAVTGIVVFGISALMFILAKKADEFAKNAFKSSSKINIGLLALLAFFLVKALNSYFVLSFVNAKKSPEFAVFDISNNTWWADDVVVWFAKNDAEYLCPVIINVLPFTSTSTKAQCPILKDTNYKIFANWAQNKPEIAKQARSK